MSRSVQNVVFASVLLVTATQAQAHMGQGAVGGFWSGFFHPLFGLDHIVAMVGVGLWGAFLGSPAIWILPVVFPMVMAFGGMLGIMGCRFPEPKSGSRFRASFLARLFFSRCAHPTGWRR